MENTYKGGDVALIQLYLEGKELQYKTFFTENWINLTYKYKEPSDIYRVSNNTHTFRRKPQDVITKVYMHYGDMEKKVQAGQFYCQKHNHLMFDSPDGMNKHLEFTFTNGKLTKVEMKESTS